MARQRTTAHAPLRRPKRKGRLLDTRAALRRHPEAARTLKRLEGRLTEAQKKRFDEVAARLDRDFLEEKAELVRDTLMEVHRRKQEGPSALLQRNVWSSLDAIALHLDEARFTRLLKQVAPRLFREEALNRTEVVDLEWDLLLEFLGIEAEEAAAFDMPRTEIDWIFDFAEREKHGGCGLPYITSKEFTLKEFFQTFCGRPDQILEIHHSPQGKATAAIITGVVDVIALFGAWPLTVITVIVLIVIGCAGC